MKKQIGRPTKYNDEIQRKAERYLYEWQLIGDVIPSRVGLCCWLEICKQTSYEWEKHTKFLATLRAVDTLQEHTSLNRGITGEFNATITKLILANHGYSDKQQTEVKANQNTKVELIALNTLDDFYKNNPL